MPDYKVEWFIDKRVIMERYQNKLTLENISAAQEDVTHMLDTGQAPVHNVVDFWEVTDVNFNLAEILSFDALKEFTAHPQLGWVVFIGDKDNKLTQLIGATTAQFYDFKARWYDTLDDALDFLFEMDDTLKSSQ